MIQKRDQRYPSIGMAETAVLLRALKATLEAKSTKWTTDYT